MRRHEYFLRTQASLLGVVYLRDTSARPLLSNQTLRKGADLVFIDTRNPEWLASSRQGSGEENAVGRQQEALHARRLCLLLYFPRSICSPAAQALAKGSARGGRSERGARDPARPDSVSLVCLRREAGVRRVAPAVIRHPWLLTQERKATGRPYVIVGASGALTRIAAPGRLIPPALLVPHSPPRGAVLALLPRVVLPDVVRAVQDPSVLRHRISVIRFRAGRSQHEKALPIARAMALFPYAPRRGATPSFLSRPSSVRPHSSVTRLSRPPKLKTSGPAKKKARTSRPGSGGTARKWWAPSKIHDSGLMP
ncbi:hypothetical protein HPB48_010693 [Haemaphysalis longicornis]|uniref:Uncharacterized protein n=1 Tax=Haemaphysalis longicornis TaxID=44386 RepID=A0A9J6G2F6_HAELO|nr:hypothetical protein HPB48_010693 [Haemaphysalis longicornis]